MHKCSSYFQCVHCRRRVCTVSACGKEVDDAKAATMEFKTLGWTCAQCMPLDNVTSQKLLELREAWLDLPFVGIVPKGWGDSIARLVNAATEIVDPDRTLRDTADAKRRGDIASLRCQAEWYADQVATVRNIEAGEHKLDAALFAQKLDEAIRLCRERWGVELTVSPERKPWVP